MLSGPKSRRKAKERIELIGCLVAMVFVAEARTPIFELNSERGTGDVGKSCRIKDKIAPVLFCLIKKWGMTNTNGFFVEGLGEWANKVSALLRR